MTIIKTTKALAAFCKKAANESAKKGGYLTVDTEFVSEKVYWPTLCLIQVGTESEAVCIDPLAKEGAEEDGEPLDLKPLQDLFENTKILKVFHACGQDMAIFHHLFGKLPQPIFDTQIAAMVCGHGESISYARLVQEIVGVDIDKTSQFTNWAARPLSDQQISYALSDVTHLRPVYEKIKSEIDQMQRHSWIEEEMTALADPATYVNDPQECWRKIKKLRNPKPAVLNNLRELAAWREEKAREKNLPKTFILRDQILVELATQAPKSVKDLEKLRGFPKGLVDSWMTKDILEALKKAADTPRDDWPKRPRGRRGGEDMTAVMDLLRVLLKKKCEEHNVASRLIANADDLKNLAENDAPDIRALKGWRYDLFGKHAVALKNGELGMRLKNNEIEFVELS